MRIRKIHLWSTLEVCTAKSVSEDATIVWHARPVDEGRGLDLEDVVRHLLGVDASLGGGCRTWNTAGRRSTRPLSGPLQSHLHKVSGRRATGERTILRCSSAASDFGVNTVLLAVKFGGELHPTR